MSFESQPADETYCPLTYASKRLEDIVTRSMYDHNHGILPDDRAKVPLQTLEETVDIRERGSSKLTSRRREETTNIYSLYFDAIVGEYISQHSYAPDDSSEVRRKKELVQNVAEYMLRWLQGERAVKLRQEERWTPLDGKAHMTPHDSFVSLVGDACKRFSHGTLL